MALANYNATLEYATNTLQFWNVDDAGAPTAFAVDTVFSIERMDNNTATQSWNQSVNSDAAAGFVEFVVTPSKGILWSAGDTLYDMNDPVYEHIWSLKSPSTNVYVSGYMNLIEVA